MEKSNHEELIIGIYYMYNWKKKESLLCYHFHQVVFKKLKEKVKKESMYFYSRSFSACALLNNVALQQFLLQKNYKSIAYR